MVFSLYATSKFRIKHYSVLLREATLNVALIHETSVASLSTVKLGLSRNKLIEAAEIQGSFPVINLAGVASKYLTPIIKER